MSITTIIVLHGFNKFKLPYWFWQHAMNKTLKSRHKGRTEIKYQKVALYISRYI